MDRTEAAKLVEILRHQCADYAKNFPDVWKKIDMMLARKAGIRRSYEAYQKAREAHAESFEEAQSIVEEYAKEVGGDPTKIDGTSLEQYKVPPKVHDPWPDWCFLPVAVLDKSNPLEFSEIWMNRSRIPELLTLGSWRQTQGVYLVDETVLEELWKTPLTGKIPVELLYRLPEWTTLINLPSGAFDLVEGARMALCHLTTVGQHVSIIIMLLQDNGFGTLSMPLLGTIEESMGFITGCLSNPETPVSQMAVQSFGSNGREWAKTAFLHCADDIAGVLSTLLYLCSEEPDIQGKPAKPIKTMTKQGPRFFPPDKPREILVGVRLGVALRRGREARNEPSDGVMRGTHASPRGHIRGAHWHTYWTGPRSAPVAKVKWLPPIPVNIRFGESDAVIHPVEEKVSA
jgi:hypothetical protein